MPELVFIHGWGFDARFWDALAERLPQWKQVRIDLGFFKKNSTAFSDILANALTSKEPRVLIGHSLGFAFGAPQTQWQGWVAINGFPRFVPDCVPGVALREMRMRLKSDPAKCLADFHKTIGTTAPGGEPNDDQLREGLDALRDADIEKAAGIRRIPGLVLAGKHDPLVPVETSEKLGHYASDGATFDEGGQILPQSNPDFCAATITQFMARHFP
jgi:pimeloyl-[acyl-carrier protein] methyl ester esterase